MLVCALLKDLSGLLSEFSTNESCVLASSCLSRQKRDLAQLLYELYAEPVTHLLAVVVRVQTCCRDEMSSLAFGASDEFVASDDDNKAASV